MIFGSMDAIIFDLQLSCGDVVIFRYELAG